VPTAVPIREQTGAIPKHPVKPKPQSVLGKHVRFVASAMWALTIPVLLVGVLGYCGYALVTSNPEPKPSPAVDIARFNQRLDAYPLVTWTYVDTTCADGWRSSSIGKRGACSHHGGVVKVWLGSDGTELRCHDGGPPRTKADQLRQLDRLGRLYC
jgi:hypothetical protein